MPISTSDVYYQAEIVPASIRTLGGQLCEAFGRPPTAFGSKGNTIHYSGYHRSRNWVLNSPDSRYGARDYSVQHTADQGGDRNWVAAFDFTPGPWGSAENRQRMIAITTRMLEAARRRDPRLRSMREFAGTIDGRTVITFNCADGSVKSPFDSSHLEHGHGSLWRSRAADDHTGIAEILMGDDMSWQERFPSPNDPAVSYTAAEYLVGANYAAWKALDAVAATAAEERVRDAAVKAAIDALSEMVRAGGGDIDSAAILRRIDEQAARAGEDARAATEDAMRRVLGGLDNQPPAG